jgi:hypothetical protein
MLSVMMLAADFLWPVWARGRYCTTVLIMIYTYPANNIKEGTSDEILTAHIWLVERVSFKCRLIASDRGSGG